MSKPGCADNGVNLCVTETMAQLCHHVCEDVVAVDDRLSERMNFPDHRIKLVISARVSVARSQRSTNNSGIVAPADDSCGLNGV